MNRIKNAYFQELNIHLPHKLDTYGHVLVLDFGQLPSPPSRNHIGAYMLSIVCYSKIRSLKFDVNCCKAIM